MKKAVLVGIVIGMGLAAPALLMAKNQRYYPGYCQRHLAVDSNTEGTFVLNSEGVFNNHSTDSLLISCPIDDSTYLAKETLHHINVHTINNNAHYPVRVRACVKDYTSTAHACGLEDNASAGTHTLQPGLAQFTAHPTWFGYLFVTLPARYSSQNSFLLGYYGTD